MSLIYPDEVFAIKEVVWPQVTFYDKEVEIIESTFANVETHVVAGNKLGKDFAAGFIMVVAFLICYLRDVRCRIVTTSVDEEHLKVLWAEAARFCTQARQPVLAEYGGPLMLHHMMLTRASERIVQGKNPDSYVLGLVAEKAEKMGGHHAEWTLFIGDEASGLDDPFFKAAQGWAEHFLFIGNPFPCQNFWKKAIEMGDLVGGGEVLTVGGSNG
jgi:hypothetical protein